MKSILFMAALVLGSSLAQATPEFVCEQSESPIYGTNTILGNTLMKVRASFPAEMGGAVGLEVVAIIGQYSTNQKNDLTYKRTVEMNREACERIKAAIRLNQTPIFDLKSMTTYVEDDGSFKSYPAVEYVIGSEALPYAQGISALTVKEGQLTLRFSEIPGSSANAPKMSNEVKHGPNEYEPSYF
jgi:hypothetical protein